MVVSRLSVFYTDSEMSVPARELASNSLRLPRVVK